MIFDEESTLHEKSETEDKAQRRAPNSSADTQKKIVKFSKRDKRPDRSDEDSSDSDGDEHEATQEQPRPLRRSVRVTMPPTRYDWEDDHVSFELVIETCDPSSYNEVIEADDHDKWITAIEKEMESLDRN